MGQWYQRRSTWGTHPIFESDFDCLTEEREMGTAFTKVGSRVGPNGTQFIGDIRGQAAYGLPLRSHPVQDVIAKTEPINYIRNTLYPKAGARFLILPRQYALVPTNNGVFWGAWRYGHSRAIIYQVALFCAVMYIWAANSAYGGKFNKSWRGGDSILYGNTGKNLHEEHLLANKLGSMYH